MTNNPPSTISGFEVFLAIFLFLLAIWIVWKRVQIMNKVCKTFYYHYWQSSQVYGSQSLIVYENIEEMPVTHHVIPITKYTNIPQELAKVRAEWRERGYHVTLELI